MFNTNLPALLVNELHGENAPRAVAVGYRFSTSIDGGDDYNDVITRRTPTVAFNP